MRSRVTSAVLATGLAALFAAAPASGATVNLGQIAPMGVTSSCSGCTVFQLQMDPASPSYAVPPGGPWTVTSWTARGGSVADSARLRVFRPTPFLGRLEFVAESADVAFAPGAAPVTPVSVPVLPGDLIGLRTLGGAGDMTRTHPASSANDQTAGVSGAILLGQTTGPGGTYLYGATPATRINVSATLTAPDPVPKQKCKQPKKKGKPSAVAAKKKKKKCRRKKGKEKG